MQYRSVQSDSMLGTRATGVKFVAAMFLVAMLYSSFCSAACAAGYCPLLAHSADADQCCHETSGHPCPHHGTPEHSDCATHGHPTNFVTTAGLPQLQFSIVASLAVGPSVAQVSGPAISLSHLLWGTDLGPPISPKNPLYQQISSLRI